MRALNITDANPSIFFQSKLAAYSEAEKKRDEKNRKEFHQRTRAFKGVFLGSVIGICCWTSVIFSVVSIFN